VRLATTESRAVCDAVRVLRCVSLVGSSTVVAAQEWACIVVELVTRDGSETAGHGTADERGLVEGVRTLALARVPVADHAMRFWCG
jgi:hypothetical protein